MDTQGQQHPAVQIPPEELQQIIAQAVRVVAQFDHHTLSQLRVNQQLVDEVAQAVIQEILRATQPLIPPEPEWTVEEMRIEDLMHEEDLEHEIEFGYIFGPSYTRINRYGGQVLYMLSEYYDDSVLKAAKEDDIHPAPRESATVHSVMLLGDLRVASVHTGSNPPDKTLEVIRRKLERKKDPYQFTPTLTASSQPRIEIPTYRRGERRARQ